MKTRFLFRVFLPLAVVLFSSHSFSQTFLNVGFEHILNNKPTNWYVDRQGYDWQLDSVVVHSGKNSLRLRYVPGAVYASSTRVFPLEMARGKKIRFSGYIKTESVGRGYAGLWGRVDGGNKTLASENMRDRGAKGATPWKRYEIAMQVDSAANDIVFGFQFSGDGTAWFDDLRLEFDDQPIGDTSILALGSADDSPVEILPLWMRGGRSGRVKGLTFIENGKLLVSHGSDFQTVEHGVVRIHEVPGCKLVHALRFDGSNSAVSHDGQLLASDEHHVDYTHDLHIWNLRQGRELKRFNAPGDVYHIAFSADDKVIAACGRLGFVSIWEVETGRMLKSYPGFTEDVYNVMFSPDDKFLIAKGGESKQFEIRIWDTKTGELKLSIPAPNDYSRALALSPNGGLLAFSDTSGYIDLVEFPTGKRLAQFSTKEKSPETLTFSPDGKMLLLGSEGSHSNYFGDNYDNTIQLWNIEDVTSGREFRGHSSDVHSLAFAPDGKSIVCGLDDGSAPLWDVGTGTMLRRDVDRISQVKAAAFSSDGKSVMTFDAQGIIHAWDSKSGDSLSIAQFDEEIGLGATISPANDLIAASRRYEGVINLISASTGQSAMTVSAGGTDFRHVTFSNRGRFLLASSQYEVVLWQTKSGRCLRRFKVAYEPQMRLAFSPSDGLYAASLTNSKNILVWKTNSDGLPIKLSITEHQFPKDMMFSNDGNLLAATYLYGPVRIWDLVHKKVEKLLEPEASSLAYSPDGKFLATSDTHGTINIWNAKTYSLVARLNTAFKTSYKMLQWSAERRHLLGLTDDGAIAVWRVPDSVE